MRSKREAHSSRSLVYEESNCGLSGEEAFSLVAVVPAVWVFVSMKRVVGGCALMRPSDHAVPCMASVPSPSLPAHLCLRGGNRGDDTPPMGYRKLSWTPYPQLLEIIYVKALSSFSGKLLL